MNEETTLPTEGADLQIGVPYATEISETTSQETDGSVTAPEPSQGATVDTIWEDLSGAAYEETIPETTMPTITIEIIESIAMDQIHADLFGSFLVCGTLVALTIFGRIHGT